MFDARVFVPQLDSARDILTKTGANFQGEYVIHDAIYRSTNPSHSLGDTFLRLRHIAKNIWSEKDYIVTIKNTELLSVGKQSHIQDRAEFDAHDEAEKYIQEHYANDFTFQYEFDRTGWQYDRGKDQIDLEDIEGHCSIEFKSPTHEGLLQLLNEFSAPEPIRGPSVIAIQTLLQR